MIGVTGIEAAEIVAGEEDGAAGEAAAAAPSARNDRGPERARFTVGARSGKAAEGSRGSGRLRVTLRVRTLIIAAVCGLFGIAGSGCSMVLGLEDPTADFGDDDGGDDIPPPGADHLTLNLTVVQIAQSQRVKLRVTAVYLDGMMLDATASATYESDAPGVAAVGTPGQLEGGTQAGTVTITVRLGTARPATVAVTVLPKTCAPVINEFQTEGANGATDEWVEILNPCTGAIPVNGWTLAYRGAGTTGGTDSNLLFSLTGELQPGEIKLIAGANFTGAKDGALLSGLGGPAGAIALRPGPLSTGTPVDKLAYGGAGVTLPHPFLEGTSPLPVMMSGRSAARLPFDGHDEDINATDFVQLVVGAATPGAPNAP